MNDVVIDDAADGKREDPNSRQDEARPVGWVQMTPPRQCDREQERSQRTCIHGPVAGRIPNADKGTALSLARTVARSKPRAKS